MKSRGNRRENRSAGGFIRLLKSCVPGPHELFVNTSTHFGPRAIASSRFRLTQSFGKAKLTRKYIVASLVQGFDSSRETDGLKDSSNRQQNWEHFPALANPAQLRASAGLVSCYRSST